MKKNDLTTVELLTSILNELIDRYCKKHPDEYCFDELSVGFGEDGKIKPVDGSDLNDTLDWVLQDIIPDLTGNKADRAWSDTERLVMGDILRHLKTDGYNGWLSLLRELASRSDLNPLNCYLG